MLSSGQLNSDFALATDVSVATTSSSILSGEKHVGFMVEDEKLGTDKEVEYESTSGSNVRSARKHSTAAAISEFNDQYRVNPIHSLAALSADDGPLVDQNQSNARRHQLLGFNKRKTIWRPICAQGMGILIGWIFLIIPSSNFWLRALVRDQWFSLLAVIAYTEIMDNCMPDSSTTVYILSYIIGFLGPPALELIAWASSLEDNYYMNTFIPTIPCFVAIIAYGYDAFTNQAGIISSDSKLALSDTFNSVNLSSGKKSFVIQLSLLQSTLANPGPPTSVSNSGTSTNHGWLKFTPRYLFHQGNPPHTSGPERWIVWAFASAFVLMWVIIWEFVMNFTLEFRKYAGNARALELLFLVFVGFNNVLRTIIKRIGLRNDLFKQGTTSMFFVAETLGLFFYYIFYRVLFESISAWSVFFTLQIFHLSSEWVLYPLRASCFSVSSSSTRRLALANDFCLADHMSFIVSV
jgi:hypothetical protein